MPKKKKKVVVRDTLENEIQSKDEEQEELIDEDELDEDEDDSIEDVDVEDALDDDSIPVEEKLDLVKAAWETSELKAADYLDGWQREKAEFANYKKRVNRDREQYNKDAVGKVVKKYLPVLDDLERALKDKPVSEDHETWANGIELIYRKMVITLENDGVFPMDVDGAIFDPNLHEAVAQIESDEHESGQIIEVIQTGYTIGERILRPAKVCIAA